MTRGERMHIARRLRLYRRIIHQFHGALHGQKTMPVQDPGYVKNALCAYQFRSAGIREALSLLRSVPVSTALSLEEVVPASRIDTGGTTNTQRTRGYIVVFDEYHGQSYTACVHAPTPQAALDEALRQIWGLHATWSPHPKDATRGRVMKPTTAGTSPLHTQWTTVSIFPQET